METVYAGPACKDQGKDSEYLHDKPRAWSQSQDVIQGSSVDHYHYGTKDWTERLLRRTGKDVSQACAGQYTGNQSEEDCNPAQDGHRTFLQLTRIRVVYNVAILRNFQHFEVDPLHGEKGNENRKYENNSRLHLTIAKIIK